MVHHIKYNWHFLSLLFPLISGQKVVQCYCIREKRFDIDAMATAGKSEKMAKQRERITWNWKFKEQKWVATRFVGGYFLFVSLSLSLSIVLCVLVPHFINQILWMIYIHWFERLDRVQPNGIAIIFATSSIQFNLDPDEKEACKISASENRIWSETFSKSHLIRLVDQISHKNPHNFTNNEKNRRMNEKKCSCAYTHESNLVGGVFFIWKSRKTTEFVIRSNRW